MGGTTAAIIAAHAAGDTVTLDRIACEAMGLKPEDSHVDGGSDPGLDCFYCTEHWSVDAPSYCTRYTTDLNSVVELEKKLIPNGYHTEVYPTSGGIVDLFGPDGQRVKRLPRGSEALNRGTLALIAWAHEQDGADKTHHQPKEHAHA